MESARVDSGIKMKKKTKTKLIAFVCVNNIMIKIYRKS